MLMNKFKILVLLTSFLASSGCSYNSPYRYLNWKTWEKTETTSSSSSSNIPSSQANCGSIGLQNLETREVVRCYNNEQTSAEACAEIFEKKGYVRFRDIPYKTADYDFLKVDTYPTRRWRDSEVTSRW